MPDNTPFFVIGAGRSGTTLLRLILAGHSRLHIPPETRFVRPLVRELPLSGELTPAQIERAVTIMTEDYRWLDMEIAADDLRHWALSLPKPELVDIIDLVYRQLLARADKPRFGDKTPIYFEIVPQLAALYPVRSSIHLIRDGRDVAISRIDLDWDRYYERNTFSGRSRWPSVGNMQSPMPGKSSRFGMRAWLATWRERFDKSAPFSASNSRQGC